MPPFRSNKPTAHKYSFVFAAADCGTGTRDGLTVHLRKGQIWDATDPVVLEHSHDGLFVDEPLADMICRSTPDPQRAEEALAAGTFAAEVAEADRDRPTSTLIRY
jgi:hypothetical protein